MENILVFHFNCYGAASEMIWYRKQLSSIFII